MGKHSNYYGVYKYTRTARRGEWERTNTKYWEAQVVRPTGKMRKSCSTEREAALVVDKYLLSIGEEPRNILVRK